MKTGRKEEVNMKIKVGLVGTSQLSFAGPKQEVYAKIIDQMKKNSAEMNFDLVIWPEQIISEPDAKRAVDFMEGEKIDFLLILNISYSSGFLAPVLYRIKTPLSVSGPSPKLKRSRIVQFFLF